MTSQYGAYALHAEEAKLHAHAHVLGTHTYARTHAHTYTHTPILTALPLKH